MECILGLDCCLVPIEQGLARELERWKGDRWFSFDPWWQVTWVGIDKRGTLRAGFSVASLGLVEAGEIVGGGRVGSLSFGEGGCVLEEELGRGCGCLQGRCVVRKRGLVEVWKWEGDIYILSEGPGESMGFVEVKGGREGKVKGPLAFFGGRADCFAEPFRSQ